jgi:2-polyprenyl-6-methoxyphenol hydroxylase-like FAD-dependent oxidoreductase
VLVGDAAHASSPRMGQGGCMAMEDACVLAEELHLGATVEAAVPSFAKRRKPRVEWVQHQSMAVTQMQALPTGSRAVAQARAVIRRRSRVSRRPAGHTNHVRGLRVRTWPGGGCRPRAEAHGRGAGTIASSGRPTDSARLA